MGLGDLIVSRDLVLLLGGIQYKCGIDDEDVRQRRSDEHRVLCSKDMVDAIGLLVRGDLHRRVDGVVVRGDTGYVRSCKELARCEFAQPRKPARWNDIRTRCVLGEWQPCGGIDDGWAVGVGCNRRQLKDAVQLIAGWHEPIDRLL